MAAPRRTPPGRPHQPRRDGGQGDRRGGPSNPRAPDGSRGPLRFRDRLRKDVMLFGLCLGCLAFTTAALAVSWRLFGEPLLLGLAVLSVLPAFYLFYLRDSAR